MQAAEHAVLNGIAATERYSARDDAFLLKLLRSRSNGLPILFINRSSHLHTSLWSFGRLFLLTPISRDCFVLRILLGIAVGTCSRILHRGFEEIEDVLCAALQELPRLEARSIAGAK